MKDRTVTRLFSKYKLGTKFSLSKTPGVWKLRRYPIKKGTDRKLYLKNDGDNTYIEELKKDEKWKRI